MYPLVGSNNSNTNDVEKSLGPSTLHTSTHYVERKPRLSAKYIENNKCSCVAFDFEKKFAR